MALTRRVPVTADRSFPASWKAEVLAERPAILPRRHFVYPAVVEEVERGALELMVRGIPGYVRAWVCKPRSADRSVELS
jgi:hypothetical protein